MTQTSRLSPDVLFSTFISILIPSLISTQAFLVASPQKTKALILCGHSLLGTSSQYLHRLSPSKRRFVFLSQKIIAFIDIAFQDSLSHSNQIIILPVYRLNLLPHTSRGLLLIILTHSYSYLNLPPNSLDSMVLPVLLSDCLTLLVDYPSLSTLLTMANLLHCSTYSLNFDFRIRLLSSLSHYSIHYCT